MNEVFGLGIKFYQLIVLVITIVIGTIAVRISLSFDINKYQENKHNKQLNKLKNICTHHSLVSLGDSHGMQSLLVSPPGTLQWQCQRCGGAKYFVDGEIEQMTEYYANNIDEYQKREKRFRKLAKKMNLV